MKKFSIKKEAKKIKLPIMYKGGIDTQIADKHFKTFNKRFQEENASVLAEAEEEMRMIRQKKSKKWLANRRDQWKSIPKAQKDEYFRRKNFIRSINQS